MTTHQSMEKNSLREVPVSGEQQPSRLPDGIGANVVRNVHHPGFGMVAENNPFDRPDVGGWAEIGKEGDQAPTSPYGKTPFALIR
ncbi:MAG: hypothetical protein XD69_0888 [Clostridia bacterium 62_21]|nr:MAG: hypothetical protein XD69_0888 [Clostridia bacterium 62_21]